MRRLRARGNDTLSGSAWDGWSYDWRLERERPVRLGNVTVGERVKVKDSEAVVLDIGV